MRKLKIKWAILHNLYKTFHSAYFYEQVEGTLEKYNVDRDIYALTKANAVVKHDFGIDLREYI